MYAIIADSGQQFKVQEGQQLQIDFREASVGDKITFDQVLAISDEGNLKLGRPMLKGAKVTAEIVAVAKGPKLVIQRMRRRKNHRCHTGHRQIFTEVKIDKIVAG